VGVEKSLRALRRTVVSESANSEIGKKYVDEFNSLLTRDDLKRFRVPETELYSSKVGVYLRDWENPANPTIRKQSPSLVTERAKLLEKIDEALEYLKGSIGFRAS
jgi:hypothetical protein